MKNLIPVENYFKPLATSLLLSIFFSSTTALAKPVTETTNPISTVTNKEVSTWLTGEALLWSIKATPIAVPLLTTFEPGSPSDLKGLGGEIGVPGTIVLSPDHLSYGQIPGIHLAGGFWFDDSKRLGMELSGFILENTRVQSSTTSNDIGSPSLRVPFFNPPPGDGFPLGESSFILADHNFASGGQTITASTQFWGMEYQGLHRLIGCDLMNLTVLGGFRYLNLQESLNIYSTENALNFGSGTASDHFGTRNQFYSGELGLKAEGHANQFFALIEGKVALGFNHEIVNIQGITMSSGGFATEFTQSEGGLFTQQTNIGQQSKNLFTVVPEIKLQVGMDLTPNIRALVGYNFLYISNVARPGEQIDRTLNLTQNDDINQKPSTLKGSPRPTPLFNSSHDFWAQGLNAGFELRW